MAVLLCAQCGGLTNSAFVPLKRITYKKIGEFDGSADGCAARIVKRPETDDAIVERGCAYDAIGPGLFRMFADDCIADQPYTVAAKAARDAKIRRDLLFHRV